MLLYHPCQQIIGKQPNSEEWVFNATTQMDAQGRIIPMADRKFVVIEGDVKLPQLYNLTGGKITLDSRLLHF